MLYNEAKIDVRSFARFVGRSIKKNPKYFCRSSPRLHKVLLKVGSNYFTSSPLFDSITRFYLTQDEMTD